jgi:hypothetical protein
MLRILAILFVVSIFIPVEFYVMLGSMRMEAYRVVLAGALLYAMVNFRATLQQADLVDILLLGSTGFVFASIWGNHGLAKAVESTGLYAVETLGAFYLARLFITTPQRFYQIHQWFIVILAFLSLFTVYEAFSHHRILHDIAHSITGHEGLDPRLSTVAYVRSGIMRAANLFEHPILYGTLTAIFFPFAMLLALRCWRWGDLAKIVGLLVSMALTLSSAPFLSLIFQALTAVVVKFWNSARQFWVSIFFAGLAGSVLIGAFSNRGFFGILISYLTLNPNTGYFRIMQWDFTADDIADNPILGIGLIAPGMHDWTRPYWMEWMGNSIDSFWLLLILQHGLFALLLLLLACLYIIFRILNLLHHHDEHTRWLVTAWLLSFTSMIFIGFTVDYFGKLQPMFFFMLGAIGWAQHVDLWNRQAEKLASTGTFTDTGTAINRIDNDQS